MSAQPATTALTGSIAEVLQRAADRLAQSDSPRLDAEILLAHVLGCPRSYLYAHPEAALTRAQAAAFEQLLEPRQQQVPVAYLTGSREFWSLSLAVTPATLVPRPETELLVEAALERSHDHPGTALADLGTGCGAIAIALATELLQARLVATEISPEPLTIARQNAGRLCPGRIDLRQGDWFEPLAAERFDLIISNPPYVETDSTAINASALAHEPRAALAAGPDGLADLQRLIHGAGNYLKQDGWLLLEHGPAQVRALTYLLEAGGYRHIETRSDMAGLARITLAQWPH